MEGGYCIELKSLFSSGRCLLSIDSASYCGYPQLRSLQLSLIIDRYYIRYFRAIDIFDQYCTEQ
jgi:hypothetical protein